jgi:hypothetical protein
MSLTQPVVRAAAPPLGRVLCLPVLVLYGMAWLLVCATAPAKPLELRDAVVVVPPGLSRPEQNAVRMLIEEVARRTHVTWQIAQSWPTSNIPVIAVCPMAALDRLPGSATTRPIRPQQPGPAEGYQISARDEGSNPTVYVLGNDARGVLFGVGRLLREFHLRRDSVLLDDLPEVISAPKYKLRGHQLGFRPKTNTYDAWDLPQWEQYFRDLAVFGANAVELIPPRSDDEPDSPHFARPPMEMMVGMSQLADDYGLDVWVWYPALDRDYSEPQTLASSLREWGEVFAKLPRLDAVFVPGGDPGHTAPHVLLSLLEKQTENLHRYHPKAEMWVSPQGFDQAWLAEFLDILNNNPPAWLTGLVFGPQIRISLPRLRQLVPARFPIRHYPDITHSRQCQYPVPDWDAAYAVTEARECINPRPQDEAAIFRRLQPDTIGFITYSEGCNDDVNKCVWSALGWNPDTDLTGILRQYSRYFISDRYEDDFAQGLLNLEQNWRGPLLANKSVETTLEQFQDLERAATPADLKNWRFQQALFRAYYDAYVRRRLIWETGLEAQAMERLRLAPSCGAVSAVNGAEAILDRAGTEQVCGDWRGRILQLGEALFQSIGMQLSVERYQAIAVDRGASLDTLDYPLNNRAWLKDRFKRIRSTSGEAQRLKQIEEILSWQDPGPGGFYDDLGDPARQPHLVRGLSFAQDPAGLESARSGFEEDLVVDEPDEAAGVPRRVSWIDDAESLYDAPLRMHYAGLDPNAVYKLRVVYGGDSPKRKIRLVANDATEIHPYMAKPVPFRPIEFPIPHSATRAGELTLTWWGEPGLGGNGRGCQVSEVWLIKERAFPLKPN